MPHPLQQIVAETDRILVIGESGRDRFPALSYDAYTRAGKAFACLDLDGRTESRGPTKGGVVYAAVADLPDDLGDLAVIWVHPHTAARAVEVAHEAGCRRVWFSFKTGHPDAVARARALGMEVVEIGRCPVYYLEGAPPVCRFHAAVTKLSGTWGRPPQTDPEASRRELL